MRFVLLGAGKTGALVAEIAATRGHTVEIIEVQENYNGAALPRHVWPASMPSSISPLPTR